MKTSIITFLITFYFHLSVYAQAPQDKATELREQALSSLKQKDYVKAYYLFKKAYEAFAVRENYPRAIECGIQTNALYVKENFYGESSELCRNMEQLVWTGEQKQNKVSYDLCFSINKERLQMYISLKNPAQAKNQLDGLEEIASLAKNDSLMEVPPCTKANYYYIFNQNIRGDACFRKLISQHKEKKDYDKVNDCYKTLIGITRKANSASLMERTYESYIVWTDSVKALTTQDKPNVLKRKYDEGLQTTQDKDSTISAKQYIIIRFCTFVVIPVATIVILAILLLRFITGNRKLRKSVVIANGHDELKTKFIRNISSQVKPILNTLGTSAKKLSAQAPGYAEQIQAQVAALKQFSDNIQELPSLESSLTEPCEMGEVNAGTFYESVMEKAKESVKPGVIPSVNIPKLRVKTNKEQLERILLYLLENAAFYTEQGRISLDFEKRGAHTHQFIITDTKTDIPAEQQEDLSEPFTRTKDLTTSDSLGLPICSLIATKMDDGLTLDTSYIKGCWFILELHA